MNWRWIFYINIPAGILAVVMAKYFIFDPPYLKRGRMKIDYWGLALLAVGLGSLQIVLDKGQREDWFNSSLIIAFSVVAVVTLLALIYVELTRKEPIVNLRLFKDVSFASGNLVMFMVGYGLYGSVVMIPLFLQTLMGYDATLAGMVLAPGGVATLVTMPFVGAYIQKHDGRWVVLAGLLTGAWSMYLMHGFTLDASYWDFVWPRMILGVALAMIFVPLTTVTLSTIPKEEMGNATGIFNLLRNIGGSVGIALCATLLARLSQSYQTTLAAHVNPYDPVTQARLSELKAAAIVKGADAATSGKSAIAILYHLVQREAGILSYNYIFWTIGLVFLVITPLLFLLKKPKNHATVEMH